MSDEQLDDDLDPTGDDDGGFDPAARAAARAAAAFADAGAGKAEAADAADAADDDGEWEAEGDAGVDAGAMAFDFPSFDEGSGAPATGDLAMLDDVSLKVSVELGRTRMFVEDVLKLVPEAVIELDKAAGDPVDVFVNGRHVAKGEVLVLNENFCVRINEIIAASDDDD